MSNYGNGSAVVSRFTAGAIAGKTNLSVYRHCAQHPEGVVLVVEQGERSARVVALQILLNRDNDTVLVTDGAYGPKTRDAVDQFRDKVMAQSGPPGVADPGMWRFMLDRAGLQVIDAIDVTDPSVLEEAVPPIEKWTDPIVIGGMSNGVAQLVSQVRSRVGGKRNLMMLRFHGHGSPGLIAVSHGSRRVSPGIDPIAARSIITLELLPVLTPLLQQIAPLMNDFGFIELHSCRVGEGATGTRFVKQLADAFKAPVRAARSKQAVVDVFTLVGPTQAGFPGGVHLSDWASSREESVRAFDLLVNPA